MTIRTKLAAAVSLLLLATTAAMTLGVLAVTRSCHEKDVQRRVRVVESSVERAALDALLQKDDLALISYVSFVRSQYPELIYAKMTWQVGERARTLSVGAAGAKAEQEHRLQVSDPADPTRRVAVTLGIDRAALLAAVGEEDRRLAKILVLVAGATLAVGVLFSIWFARRLTAPLKALVGLAGEIGSGHLGAQLDWVSDDELGALVKVFNQMSSRLEELDEAKKRFVSSVTHELRSPLGAIESFLHLVVAQLKSGGSAAAPQTLEYLSRIQANVQRLGGFINDLLDVAKIEKGRMECALKPMKLQEIAAEVCQFFEAKAQMQGVRIEQKVGALPPVMGDPERLRQVLVNLVSNSLKFTPEGGEVSVTAEPYREGEQRWAEVAVADTGRGMEQSDVGSLFTAFSQGRNVSAGVTGHKGTGLGLFIARSIIDQHGGKISVKSTPGRGTRVIFSVKLAG